MEKKSCGLGGQSAWSSVLGADDLPNFGLKALADLVQKIGQGPIKGGLLDLGSGRADLRKFFEICFQGIHAASPKTIMPRVKELVKLFYGDKWEGEF